MRTPDDASIENREATLKSFLLSAPVASPCVAWPSGHSFLQRLLSTRRLLTVTRERCHRDGALLLVISRPSPKTVGQSSDTQHSRRISCLANSRRPAEGVHRSHSQNEQLADHALRYKCVCSTACRPSADQSRSLQPVHANRFQTRCDRSPPASGEIATSARGAGRVLAVTACGRFGVETQHPRLGPFVAVLLGCPPTSPAPEGKADGARGLRPRELYSRC